MTAPSRRNDDTPVGAIRPIAMGEMASADDLIDFNRKRFLRRRPGRVRPGTPGAPRRSSALGRGRPSPGNWRRRRRVPIPLRVVLALFVGALGYYGFNVVQVYGTGRSDQARPVDAIVVLGAAQYDGRPSAQLAARLDHVVTLYGDGLAPLIVVTGGKQPEDRFTEAEASRDYLVERGVPSSVIVLEGEGHSTYQSLTGVAELLAARNVRRVLVVTDPFHSLRSRMIAADVGLDAYVSPTPTSVVSGGADVRRHLMEAAGVAVGRLIGFDHV